MRYIKSICLVLLLTTCLVGATAQEEGYGSWRSYRAYQSATLVEKSDNLIFGVYDGSLLSYSPDDTEIRTYSTTEGLNDVDITHIKYFPNDKTLLIVYSNSNIDFFKGEHQVYNNSSLKDNLFIQNKTVNSVVEIDGLAYLCTAFGVVVIDVGKQEIKSTYRLGVDTRSITRWEDDLYAATSEGVLKAPIASNLQDRDNWVYYPLNNIPDDKRINTILTFRNSWLIVCNNQGNLYSYGSNRDGWFANGPTKSVSIVRDEIVQVREDDIHIHRDFWNKSVLDIDGGEAVVSDSWDQYWLAKGKDGLVEFIRQWGVEDYTIRTSGVTVNSPKRNLTYQMTLAGDKLLVVGGNRSYRRYNNPGTLMVLENGKWFNFDDEKIEEQTGVVCRDFLSAIVDPRDPNHYFVASYGYGLYEFQDNELVKRHTYDNSGLETCLPNYPENNVMVDGLIYDKQNNLLMTNFLTENLICAYSADKQWITSAYPLPKVETNKLIFDRKGWMWGNVFMGDNAGIYVLNNNNTIDNTADDTFYYSRSFTDQQGRTIGAKEILCLAEDKNGVVWVGANTGPFYLTGPEKVRDGLCSRVVLSDEYGEGYYLLEGQRINHIAIDGANRKWMATEGSGVFVVDQSGSETIVENYHTKNSHILSDIVNCIVIDDRTGEVFIATDKGLCSFMNEATAGESDYSDVRAYPNPARPADHTHVVVSGLMTDSTVKITDLGGNLIQEGKSQGGQYAWNLRDRSGRIVSAGIYLVFGASSDGQEGMVTKIMVIR